MGTDIHGVFQRQTADGWEDVPSKYEETRHYQLFAVLAGVRNGYGFAGIPTGEPAKPISEPRGLPDDFQIVDDGHLVSAEYYRQTWRYEYTKEGDEGFGRIWMGDHSHSWLTADEMLAWATNAPTVLKIGCISREDYETWNKVSCPSSYCGLVSGRSIRLINDSALEMAQQPDWTHVRVTWESNLAEELAYFFDEVRRLQALHGQIRFVFGFDS